MNKHTTRITALVVFAVAASAALAGCTNSADNPTPGAGADDGEIKIGYIVKRGTDPFAADQVAAAQAKADAAGIELLTADVKQDSALTISTVSQMIASGIDGLIIVVPDQALGPQVLQLAKDAGIPVLASDDPISDSAGKAAPFIGLDGPALGKQAGDILAGLVNDNAAAAPETAAFAVVSQNSVSACVERTQGAIDAFTAAAGDKATYIDVPHDGTLEDGITAMSAAITQNPNIKDWYITSCNDDGVAGALRALEATGVTKANSFGMGMDGALACTELAKDNGFYGANYVSFSTNGELAFDAMLKSLQDGADLPAFQSIPGPLITRDNKAELAGC